VLEWVCWKVERMHVGLDAIVCIGSLIPNNTADFRREGEREPGRTGGSCLLKENKSGPDQIQGKVRFSCLHFQGYILKTAFPCYSVSMVALLRLCCFQDSILRAVSLPPPKAASS
jgi:hypothetical protein